MSSATTFSYSLSLLDALPILLMGVLAALLPLAAHAAPGDGAPAATAPGDRQSTRLNSSPHLNLVCRLLLVKKSFPARKGEPTATARGSPGRATTDIRKRDSQS